MTTPYPRAAAREYEWGADADRRAAVVRRESIRMQAGPATVGSALAPLLHGVAVWYKRGMGAPQAKGFSLWLMPEGAPRERLAGWIDRLADRYGSERFPPHVTLLAGADGPRDDVLARSAKLAARLARFAVRLDGVDGGEEHFRCLFARVTPSGPLLAAHEVAARAFAREPEPGYLPHVSLLYGSLSPDQKQILAREIGSEVALGFQARRLHVWSTEGPVAEWGELDVLDLGRR